MLNLAVKKKQIADTSWYVDVSAKYIAILFYNGDGVFFFLYTDCESNDLYPNRGKGDNKATNEMHLQQLEQEIDGGGEVIFIISQN